MNKKIKLTNANYNSGFGRVMRKRYIFYLFTKINMYLRRF
jgi:hypothetical protein